MKRTALSIGILLILVGAVLLAMQFVPALQEWAQWPMILVAVGVVFLVAAFTSGNGDLAIPGMITGGIGGILLWQEITRDFNSWSYAWALIPGFVGLGILLANLINRDRLDRGGGVLLLISGFAFAAFYASEKLDVITSEMIWPFALIFVGVLILFNNFTRRQVNPKNEDE
ncbi:MAG: hypothetical protein V2J07_12035 [Anaerolineae bacterium]|jgi:hypothetical protein|nr:hypothetical protein [Anaerolineae bacterium]